MSGRPAIDSLMRALDRHFGPLRDIATDTVEWHSATYSGEQHKIGFTVENNPGLDVRLDSLPDLDILLRRGFVGSIVVVAKTVGDAGVAIGIEALTIGG